MKLMDENGRIFGKINIFDLIVLLALVLGVAFILLRPAAQEPVEREYQSAVVTMKIEGVRDYIAEAYAVGDTLYEGTTELGTLKEIKMSPQKVVKLQPDGSYKEVERKLYFEVELIFETDQYYEDEGQFINGKGMLYGTNHTISNGIVNNEASVRLIQKEE